MEDPRGSKSWLPKFDHIHRGCPRRRAQAWDCPPGGVYAMIGGMSRAVVNAICKRFPGAEVSDPWGGGHDAWKVAGKMFACIDAVTPGVSVKTDSIETAEMLIDAGVGRRAPYFHRSWILLPFETPRDELRHRLEQSYRIVRAGLPKKVRAGLDPFG